MEIPGDKFIAVAAHELYSLALTKTGRIFIWRNFGGMGESGDEDEDFKFIEYPLLNPLPGEQYIAITAKLALTNKGRIKIIRRDLKDEELSYKDAKFLQISSGENDEMALTNTGQIVSFLFHKMVEVINPPMGERFIDMTIGIDNDYPIRLALTDKYRVVVLGKDEEDRIDDTRLGFKEFPFTP